MGRCWWRRRQGHQPVWKEDVDCVGKGREQKSRRCRERQVVGPRREEREFELNPKEEQGVKLETELRQELELKPEF